MFKKPKNLEQQKKLSPPLFACSLSRAWQPQFGHIILLQIPFLFFYLDKYHVRTKVRPPLSARSPSRAWQLLSYLSPALQPCLLHSLQSKPQTPRTERKGKWRKLPKYLLYEMSAYPFQRFINCTENWSLCASLWALQGRWQDCLGWATIFSMGSIVITIIAAISAQIIAWEGQ